MNAQLDDGGWNLNVSNPTEKDFEQNKKIMKSDPDITGMALTVLAPYRAQSKVKNAIGEGVNCLSKMQNSDGGFKGWNKTSSESISQAICGLLAVGINPNSDSRLKNGNSLVDALLDYYDAKVGGFKHVNKTSNGYEPVVNQMATEQAYYALASYINTVPDKVAISKASKVSKTSLKVTWKHAAKGSACSGYQITAATNAKFTKGVKKTFVNGSDRTSASISKLKKGAAYYVKVRAYKKVNGVRIYGSYSVVKKVKL